jgi:hypothetical protein
MECFPVSMDFEHSKVYESFENYEELAKLIYDNDKEYGIGSTVIFDGQLFMYRPNERDGINQKVKGVPPNDRDVWFYRGDINPPHARERLQNMQLEIERNKQYEATVVHRALVYDKVAQIYDNNAQYKTGNTIIFNGSIYGFATQGGSRGISPHDEEKRGINDKMGGRQWVRIGPAPPGFSNPPPQGPPSAPPQGPLRGPPSSSHSPASPGSSSPFSYSNPSLFGPSSSNPSSSTPTSSTPTSSTPTSSTPTPTSEQMINGLDNGMLYIIIGIILFIIIIIIVMVAS